MQTSTTKMHWGMAAFVTGIALLFAVPALADKPSRAGGKKQAGKSASQRVEVRFGDRERSVIRAYFGKEIERGRCPPGLAKKKNGCMPPGQAKKWQMGRPLPGDVTFHDLPPKLAVELGPPPSGHRFVRVAEDILLIAVGTGMVIDAVEDLGKVLK